VFGEHVAGGDIIQTNHVKAAALRERSQIAVQEHDRDASLAQSAGNVPIDFIFADGQFKRRKKNAGHTSFNKLVANLARMFAAAILVLARVCRAAPKKSVFAAASKICEFAADDFKNFRRSQTRDQQADLAGGELRVRLVAQISAGACAPLNNSFGDQITQCTGDGGAGDFESFYSCASLGNRSKSAYFPAAISASKAREISRCLCSELIFIHANM
jgi:hypothetical protein